MTAISVPHQAPPAAGPPGMRRRSGEWEPILNLHSYRQLGDFTLDGFAGEVWLGVEFYANGGAQYPRVILTGPAAGRLAEQGDMRVITAAGNDHFRGAVVLTLAQAEELGIYTHPHQPLQFHPTDAP